MESDTQTDTPMNMCIEKNKMISQLQDIYYEYNRMNEVNLQMKSECNLQCREMISTIRNQEETITTHLKNVNELECKIKLLQKQLSEYETMIRELEDKLVNINTEKKEENKFSMIRIQAKEISNKDQEIERLKKLLLKQKDKTKNKDMNTEDKQLDCGWSPTSSQTPKIDNVLETIQNKPNELVLEIELDSEQLIMEPEPSPPDSIDIQENNKEPVQEPEPSPEVTAIHNPELINAKIITYRKKEYFLIEGEENNNIYEVLEGDKMGNKIGHWELNAKNKRKVVLDK